MFKYKLFLHTNSQGYLWGKKKKPRHKGTSKTTSYLNKVLHAYMYAYKAFNTTLYITRLY